MLLFNNVGQYVIGQHVIGQYVCIPFLSICLRPIHFKIRNTLLVQIANSLVDIFTLSRDIFFFMTTPILIWLIYFLKLITIATQSYIFSCQTQRLYPKAISNLIVFQLQNVLFFHLG